MIIAYSVKSTEVLQESQLVSIQVLGVYVYIICI